MNNKDRKEQAFKILMKETGLTKRELQQLFYDAGVDFARILLQISREKTQSELMN